MSFSVDVLAKIAIELQTGIGHQDRFQRLISTLRHVLACDASALLRYEGRQFIPLAIDGLAQDVLGRRFTLEGHPRLETIARAGDVVRFPGGQRSARPVRRADSRAGEPEGARLYRPAAVCRTNLIGALTLDGMSPDQFDTFSDEELRLIAALAAGALNNALLIEQLESQNILPGSPAAFEQVTHTEMIGLSPGMAQLKKRLRLSPRPI
jgi:anaerobic nitric oxide reductase transcription regulator